MFQYIRTTFKENTMPILRNGICLKQSATSTVHILKQFIQTLNELLQHVQGEHSFYCIYILFNDKKCS